MLKSIRNSSTKSLISTIQTTNGYSSSGGRRERILRIRAEQKELYGRVIRTEERRRDTHNSEVNKNEPDAKMSKNVIYKNLKPAASELTSEFYWLINRESDPKNIKIFKFEQSTKGTDETVDS